MVSAEESNIPDEGLFKASSGISGMTNNIDQLLFSFLLEQIHDVIFVLEVTADSQYRFISVNCRFQETTGLSSSMVIGKMVDEIIPAESLPMVKGKYQEAIEKRKSVHWDEVSEYPNGTKVGEVTVNPIFWPDGKCHVLVGTVHDVTERCHSQARLRELEERWRLALAASGAAAWDWDRKTNILSLSEQWKSMLGFEQEKLFLNADAIGRFVHPNDHPAVIDTVQSVFVAGAETFSLEARLRHRDGHWIWVRCQGKAVRNPQGEVIRILGANFNISLAKTIEEALHLTSLVFEHSSEGMAIFDPSGCILMVNPAFTRMRGYDQAEIIGQSARIYTEGLDGSGFFDELWAQVVANGQWKGEIWSRHKDGRLVAEYRSINAVPAADGSVRNYIEIATDMTKAKKAEELLWWQANYDSLTGLPNRNLFIDRLHQAIKNTHRGGPAFTVLYIDLDQFKEVNDTLGHRVGDGLLKDAAQRLLSCTRETDTVCRLGGDEFSVLLTSMHNSDNEDPYVIDRIAQLIVDSMAKPFKVGSETIQLSASIGIAHFPKDATDIESLMKHADQAMYDAKRQGRNCYAYFSHCMQVRAQERRRLIDDLRRAIKNQDMEVYYQPIVEISTGKITKAEALLRWQHPSRGWISPAEFIPLCEETGLILELGEWVFYKVVSEVAHWFHDRKRWIQISVNVSPLQIIKDIASCNRCINFLASQHLPPESIAVEVTEGALLQNDAVVADQLRQLNQHGVALALDDFGTGYSALSYLQQYEFQALKIDRSFVHNLGLGQTKLALCKTIILMAHQLGMQVIAEGIEIKDEADLLRDAGCDYGQGFYFCRPVPAPAFRELIVGKDHY